MKKKLKVLDLFAGTRSIARAFERAGHETYSIDWDEIHEDIDWYADISKVTAEDILERFGRPDVIWISFDCRTYSVAGIGHHRTRTEDGRLLPKTKDAEFADNMNRHVINNIVKKLNPTYFFIENPRGGMRRMDFVEDIPRYTVTYCTYGYDYMKPTDIWTNHPNPKFKKPCKNGDPCHVSAPRGSQKGLQGIKGAIERSRIPDELCDHIVKISEEMLEQNESS